MTYALVADYRTALSSWPDYHNYDPFGYSPKQLPIWLLECTTAVLAGETSNYDFGSGKVLAKLRLLSDCQRSVKIYHRPYYPLQPLYSQREQIPNQYFVNDQEANSAIYELQYVRKTSKQNTYSNTVKAPSEHVEIFARFVDANWHILARDANRTVGLAYNSNTDGPLTIAAAKLVERFHNLVAIYVVIYYLSLHNIIRRERCHSKGHVPLLG